ncbi:hypothetical protein EC991_003900 [Linnemannia zychae]|nr:hypothetical protein EC991_003900 [Linnemannia zychae]
MHLRYLFFACILMSLAAAAPTGLGKVDYDPSDEQGADGEVDPKRFNSPCPGNKAQSCGASAGNQKRAVGSSPNSGLSSFI